MGTLSDFGFFALAPPRASLARFLRLEDEAFGLHDIEEQLADHCGIGGAGHLQAGAESVKCR